MRSAKKPALPDCTGPVWRPANWIWDPRHHMILLLRTSGIQPVEAVRELAGRGLARRCIAVELPQRIHDRIEGDWLLSTRRLPQRRHRFHGAGARSPGRQDCALFLKVERGVAGHVVGVLEVPGRRQQAVKRKVGRFGAREGMIGENFCRFLRLQITPRLRSGSGCPEAAPGSDNFVGSPRNFKLENSSSNEIAA